MKSITDQFNEEVRFLKLNRRRINFRVMVEHAVKFAEEHGECLIMETGSDHDTGNWEYQGQSTLIWDWLIKTRPDMKIRCHSVDITPKSVENSKAQTQHVQYTCADSVYTLACLPEEEVKKIGVLYLDSYDWSEQLNIQSSFHHVAELAAVYRHLSDGCLIAVDDRHGPEKGKHWMVEGFMSHYLNLDPVFKNHQIGWVKAPPVHKPLEEEETKS